ncbi:hypothetical protein [Methylocella silvestris]|uniref:hypothetical protein n=1 Tax=Methylocella silvestris TaxID=199596 RepID=UPI0011AFC6A4|nr:hypothetical protein [Methylocella silvestris]
MSDPQDILGRVGDGSIGAGLTLIGAVIVAILSRKSPLAALVNDQLKLLIDAQARQIKELKEEIEALEGKVEALTKELAAARTQRGFGI